MSNVEDRQHLKEQILALSSISTKKRLSTKFIKGETPVPAYDFSMGTDDTNSVIDCILDGGSGAYIEKMNREVREYSKNRFSTLCNSGPSANLLAITAVTQKEFGDRAAKAGDEFITTAICSPSILSALAKNKLSPVFVDIDHQTLVPNVEQIEQAVVEGKTKGIVLSHILGSPYDVETIRDICDEYGIWMIEDCCSGLGSIFQGTEIGTLGSISTTDIRGGVVLTNISHVGNVLNSLCGIGCQNGSDLQTTDLQAAVGLSRLGKIKEEVSVRQSNWLALKTFMLFGYRKHFILPKVPPNSRPAWSGFHLTVKGTAPFTRQEIMDFLGSHKIETKVFYNGLESKTPHKIFGTLEDSSLLAKDTFWVGTHSGINEEKLNYVMETITEFMDKYAKL